MLETWEFHGFHGGSQYFLKIENPKPFLKMKLLQVLEWKEVNISELKTLQRVLWN
jgi:hypothetical protein